MEERERLRATMLENAAEINRLKRRIDETVKRRWESDDLRQEWRKLVRNFMLAMRSSVFPADGTRASSTGSWLVIPRRLKSRYAFWRSAPIFSDRKLTRRWSRLPTIRSEGPPF